ncbi:uncharacterized protein [Penaeus vannamei]|uniref:uncharacterized protein n=1 Tax=Penaeus vannamei TaxID=6689 RepID=UPI00387FACEB
MINADGYTYHWLDRSDGHHLQGIAIAISSRLQPSIVEVTTVDGHIMVLRLKLSFGFMSLIAVYAPSDVCKLDEKEMLYAKLASVGDSCSRRDIHGSEIGPHSLGVDAGSENSLDPHRWTWYSDVGNAAKEIDLILVSTRWRILQNCRVCRSAKFCGTDHSLVVDTLRVHFKTPNGPMTTPGVSFGQAEGEGVCLGIC